MSKEQKSLDSKFGKKRANDVTAEECQQKEFKSI